jgi:Na+/H+ antiporter NhaD/arsenite permease-like protein
MDGNAFLRRVVSGFEARVGILYAIVIVAGLFSPVILNDVVIVILTPVIIKYARQFEVDAAPLLVAEITTVNIASSLTPLGNPQNILLWSESRATFVQFVAGTIVPILLSMAIAVLALLPLAIRVGRVDESLAKLTSVRPGIYLASVAGAAIVLDLLGMPPFVSLGAGFVLGFPHTHGSLRKLAADFDVRSLLTLYVFIGGVTLLSIAVSPVIAQFAQPVASGAQPYSALFVGSVSNAISNVPATQLILNTVHISARVAPKIAVEAGLAGNIDPIGSFANLLALQMTRRAGISIKKTILLQLVIGLVSFVPAFL